MNHSRSGASSAFVLLFVASVALNVVSLLGCSGCRSEACGQGQGPALNRKNPYDATSDLQEIAGKLGLSLEGSSAKDIAEAIKTKIYVDATTKGIPRDVLSDEQFKIVTERLPEDKCEIVIEYHRFIKSLEGKKIVIVPQCDSAL